MIKKILKENSKIILEWGYNKDKFSERMEGHFFQFFIHVLKLKLINSNFGDFIYPGLSNYSSHFIDDWEGDCIKHLNIIFKYLNDTLVGGETKEKCYLNALENMKSSIEGNYKDEILHSLNKHPYYDKLEKSVNIFWRKNDITKFGDWFNKTCLLLYNIKPNKNKILNFKLR